MFHSVLVCQMLSKLLCFLFQAAHSDIESHGQLIKSVVELCDKYSKRSYKLKNQSSNFTTRQKHSIRHQPRVTK